MSDVLAAILASCPTGVRSVNSSNDVAAIMSQKHPPPQSIGEYARKSKIPPEQLQICGLEKQQPELNKHGKTKKLSPWVFNNVVGSTPEAAVKRFQELTNELLQMLKKQEQDEEEEHSPPKACEEIGREQVFVQFKESGSSLQIHVRKVSDRWLNFVGGPPHGFFVGSL